MVRQTDIRRFKGRVKENKINFSKNWNNKLDCKFFTTIRNANYSNYYMLRIKEKFTVMLKKKEYCKAILHDANVVKFGDVKTPELFVIDTGELNYAELFKKFKLKDTFTLLLFERID